jgi:hypothetical protein
MPAGLSKAREEGMFIYIQFVEYHACRLAAVLAALEAEETGAAVVCYVSIYSGIRNDLRCACIVHDAFRGLQTVFDRHPDRTARDKRSDNGDDLHAAADIAGTTTTELHHVLLGVL